MTNEERQLLLSELCARLPYKVKVQYTDPEDNRLDIDVADGANIDEPKGMPTVDVFQYSIPIDKIKLCLRPMSQMTPADGIIYQQKLNVIQDVDRTLHFCQTPESIDWLHAHHYDNRGLIEKGLAVPIRGWSIADYKKGGEL